MAAYHGYGYNKIARMPTERRIITPAAYQAQSAGRIYKKDPYEWNLATIYRMFENEAYLGHLISGKRRKESFKSKRIVKKPEDEWIVVKNNHPALITERLWKDAHLRLASRKYTSSTGFENIFSGLLKCDKCGYALGIANARNRTNYFLCNTYKKKGPERCSSHYILYDELYGTVLTDIQQMLWFLKTDRETFVEKLQRKMDTSSVSESVQIEQEIRQLESRIKELETKFDRLYDDRLDGLLSDKKFKELSAKCEADQDAATERLARLREKRMEQADARQGVEQFIRIADQYDEVTELDKELLNRLVESIVVGDRVKTEEGCEQTVIVNYRFIGEM